nr:hypothetical protein P5630_00940 [Bacillus subtilis]
MITRRKRMFTAITLLVLLVMGTSVCPVKAEGAAAADGSAEPGACSGQDGRGHFCQLAVSWNRKRMHLFCSMCTETGKN